MERTRLTEKLTHGTTEEPNASPKANDGRRRPSLFVGSRLRRPRTDHTQGAPTAALAQPSVTQGTGESVATSATASRPKIARFYLEGRAAPVRAEVGATDAHGRTLRQDLSFLALGSIIRDASGRAGRLTSVEIDTREGVPCLVLQLRYDAAQDAPSQPFGGATSGDSALESTSEGQHEPLARAAESGRPLADNAAIAATDATTDAVALDDAHHDGAHHDSAHHDSAHHDTARYDSVQHNDLQHDDSSDTCSDDTLPFDPPHSLSLALPQGAARARRRRDETVPFGVQTALADEPAHGGPLEGEEEVAEAEPMALVVASETAQRLATLATLRWAQLLAIPLIRARLARARLFQARLMRGALAQRALRLSTWACAAVVHLWAVTCIKTRQLGTVARAKLVQLWNSARAARAD